MRNLMPRSTSVYRGNNLKDNSEHEYLYAEKSGVVQVVQPSRCN
jgi:hypothetical protein